MPASAPPRNAWQAAISTGDKRSLRRFYARYGIKENSGQDGPRPAPVKVAEPV